MTGAPAPDGRARGREPDTALRANPDPATGEVILTALGAAAQSRLVDQLARLLVHFFPDAARVRRATLRAGVASQVTRARALGLVAEAHAAQYVIAAWMLGRDFEERFPEARRVLLRGAYPPALCAEWLRAWAPAVLDGLEED